MKHGTNPPWCRRAGAVGLVVLAVVGAELALAQPGATDQPPETVRIAPRIRVQMLGGGPPRVPPPHLIEPFLAEVLVVDGDSFERAPRIVALAGSGRALAAQGDRAYVRGPAGAPLRQGVGLPSDFRVFRAATPLQDPASGEILGYEGQYLGQARLVHGESEADERVAARRAPVEMPAAGDHDAERAAPAPVAPRRLPVPATVDITRSKQELRAGDRLLPESPRAARGYEPRTPDAPLAARVVRVHGGSLRYAGQNQVVVINQGGRDGVEAGHLLRLLSTGAQRIDPTDGARTRIQLPDERNGVAMVFRTFERVSYALVMEVRHPVQVGDRLVSGVVP